MQLSMDSYIDSASSVSHVSALLVCTAQHPQITHRHCSKFSVTPTVNMNITKQPTVSSIIVSDSYRHTLANCQLRIINFIFLLD